MEPKIKIINTDNEMKIFTDPYRMKIINTLLDATRPMTVKQIADTLGEVPAKVHYHVKKLIAIELLELDHIEVINGINAKFYKLLYDRFQVKFAEDDSNANLETQASYIYKTINRLIDTFKEDLADRKEVMIQSGYTQHELNLSHFEMYLTHEEFQEFLKEYNTLIEKYNSYRNEDNTRFLYNHINGIVKKTKK